MKNTLFIILCTFLLISINLRLFPVHANTLPNQIISYWDFENNQLAPWSKTWGTGLATTTDQRENVRSGNYAVMYEGQGSLEHVLTNLKTNTTYTLTGYGKTGTSTEFAIGVKEYNDSESTAKIITNTEYEKVELHFTTGKNNTSAKVYIYNRSGSGTLFADDLQIKEEQGREKEEQETLTENLEDNNISPLSDPENNGEWKYSLDYSDEFDGDLLDETKWYDHHIYWKGRAPSFFSSDNVRVENGKLILTTKYENIPQMDEVNKGLPEGATPYENYTTAAVMSKQKSHYGYFEIKAKAAPASITSSFWLKASDGDKSEIDVFEIVGDSKLMPYYSNVFPTNLHYYHDGPSGRDVQFPFNYTTEDDLTEDFHVYGVEWNEKWIKFYYDGLLVRAQKNLHWQTPEYIIMDMETFIWHGYPDVESLPADYEIDYVRVWRTDVPASDDSGFELPDPKVAQAIKGTPTIDGLVDLEWEVAQEIGSLRVKGGTTLNNASVKTMWDEKQLYILAQVQDNDLVGEDPTNTYQNDSVEIYIDEGEERSSPYDSNDVKVNVDYMTRMSGINIPENVDKAVTLTDFGYLVEFAIPWTTIAPQIGTRIGFDAQVNDTTRELGKRQGYLGWNDPMDQVWKDMGMAGVLELIDSDSLTEDDEDDDDSEQPKEGEDKEQPGDKTELPSDNYEEIQIGNDAQEVVSGKTYHIKDSSSTLTMPEDLPVGTKLKVEAKNVEETNHKGLTLSGDILTFTFEFPEGSTPPNSQYKLVLGYHKNSDTNSLAVYYYNEKTSKWEHRGGVVNKENQTIKLNVSHFSTYGVFVQSNISVEDKETPNQGSEEPEKVEGTPKDDMEITEDKDTNVVNGSKLPETATTYYNWLLFGLFIFTLGFSLVVWMRKNKVQA